MILELKKINDNFEYNDDSNYIPQEEDFKNNNNVIIDDNNMINKEFINIYKKPDKNLYESNAIKLENIKEKSRFIINKIKSLWIDIEEKNDVNLNNNFLQSVGNIARKSHKFSRKLVDKLIKDLKELNPNKSWNK
jgi:hypothetical protein